MSAISLALALIQTAVGLALVLAKRMAGATIGGFLLGWSWEAAND